MAPPMAGRAGAPERVCQSQSLVRQPGTVCRPRLATGEAEASRAQGVTHERSRLQPGQPDLRRCRAAVPRPRPARAPAGAGGRCSWVLVELSATPGAAAFRALRADLTPATPTPCPPPGADRTPPTADRPAPTGHASSVSHRRRLPAHVCTSCAGGLFTTCRPRMRPGSACACTTRPERGPHQPGRRGFQPGRAWRGAQTLNPAARMPGTAYSPRMRPTDRPMVTAPRGAPARTQRTAG